MTVMVARAATVTAIATAKATAPVEDPVQSNRRSCVCFSLLFVASQVTVTISVTVTGGVRLWLQR